MLYRADFNPSRVVQYIRTEMYYATGEVGGKLVRRKPEAGRNAKALLN